MIATQTTDALRTLSRTAFPIAFDNQDVISSNSARFKTLQEMLARANCFTTIEAHNDGAIGPKSREAIINFYNTQASQYPDMQDSIIYSDANDRSVDNIVGVTSSFVQALEHSASRDLAYKESLIRDANMMDNGRFNRHSYDIALYKEMNGHFIGQTDPNYSPFRISAADIDSLARTGFGEAPGESREGRIAAMYSIVNRTIARLTHGMQPLYFKPTVHETARAQNRNRRGSMVAQYSAWNTYDHNYSLIQALNVDGSGGNNVIFRELVDLAESIMYGEYADPINGVTHYHTDYVSPDWSRNRTPSHIIGVHEFYNLHPEVTELRAEVLSLEASIQQIQSIGQIAQTISQATQATSLINNSVFDLTPETNEYGLQVFRMLPHQRP
jgi:hypothetical protein